jgi:hypothetical protein
VKVEEVRREVAGLKKQLSDCCPKVKKELTNLEQGHAKLKQEKRTMKPKPELLSAPAAVAGSPGGSAGSPARKSSSSLPTPDAARPPLNTLQVKASLLPAPPKRAKQFPPSIGGLRDAIATSGAKLKQHIVSIKREAKDGQEQSQEREAQAMAVVRKVIGGSGRSSTLLSKKTVPLHWRQLRCPQRTSSRRRRSAG